jgi:chaperonin cofactor prefoldin
MNDLLEKKNALSTAKQELNQIKPNMHQKVYLKRGNILFISSKEEALEYLAKREGQTVTP